MKWRESYSGSSTPLTASELDFNFTPSELLTVHVEHVSFVKAFCGTCLVLSQYAE